MAVTNKARRAKEATDDLDGKREEATEAAKERLEDAGDKGGNASETAGDAVQAAIDTVKDTAKNGSQGVVKLVATAARDAAAEVLAREASKGARQAAEYVSQKAPELAMEKLKEHGGSGPAAQAALSFGKAKLEDAGGVKAALAGAGGAVKGLVEKVTGGGGGGGKEKSLGETRRLPIECQIDIGVPRETVYNQWTQFEDSPQYMHRIKQVKQGDETTFTAGAKVWGFKREWEVEITDQEPNERIAWKTVGGTKNAGVVTFHALDENLTRVLVTLDWPPDGVMEKMASGLRIIKRATQADLKRFRAFMEMRDEETGAWRGRIEDSEVVSEEDEEERDEAAEDEERGGEPEAEADEDEVDEDDREEDEPEAEADEEPEAEADEEPEAEEDEDYEEPEAEADEEPEAEEDEEEPEAEADEEPEAEADEEPEAEEEEKPKPKPRRRPQKRAVAKEEEEEKPKPRRRPQQRRQRATARK
jgi:uncharacterized membrane protein